MKSNSNITKALSTILCPILKNPIFFYCQIVLYILPIILYNHIVVHNSWESIIIQLIKHCPIYIFDAYLISLLYLLLNKFIKTNIIKVALYLFSIILCTFHSFVILFYETQITPLIIRLIRETNIDEIRGFVSTLNTPNFAYIIVLITTIIISIILAEKYLNHKLSCLASQLINRGGIVLIIRILTIISIPIIPYNITRNYIKGLAYIECNNITSIEHYLTSNDYPTLKLYRNITSYGILIHSLYCDYTIKNDIKILQTQLAEEELSKCSYRSNNIILIIGESYSKYHSNLYDYPHPTNNLLKNQVKTGNLYIFNDVITPYCTTSYVMQEIFTFKSHDDSLYWANTPMFVKFFKDNGYYTYFYSNQEIINQGGGIWDATNHFLVAQQTANYCYSATNYHRYRWDEDLINEYKSVHSKNYSTPHFTIFHLIGQHLEYSTRYHTKDAIFTAEDYTYREDLTQSQREMVAHYDNATLYNDKVVTSIIDMYRDQDAIIVYLSDHGEEVHDYRNFIGRTPTAKLTPEICKYQFEVPFMIWMSDKYKATHPDIVKQAENSLDKPFMIDDLPHLMLDIAGIDCEWFDPTRSLINERYNANRKRLLLDSKIDYDEIIKQLKK